MEGNSAYRRDVLIEFGGFPTNLGRMADLLLSGENCVNLTMQDAGWEFFYDPTIVIRHHIHRTRMSKAWFRRRMFWQGVARHIRQRYADEQCRNAKLACHVQNHSIEVTVPTSARGWLELFDDDGDDGFTHQLNRIEMLGYLLESQSLIFGG